MIYKYSEYKESTNWLIIAIVILMLFGLIKICFGQSIGQEVLIPTELEQTKLAKFKAQDEKYQQQLKVVEVEINNLQLTHQIIDQQEKQKHSEYLGYSEDVKRSHNKDWGDSVIFNPDKGEGGLFEKAQQKDASKENQKK